MNPTLNILIVEDNKNDADLLLRELHKSGFVFTFEIVETKKDFEFALENFKPDIILSDFHLPSFNGAEAYEIKKKKYPNIPFIIVSGAIGEENAVELIKNGVTDYTIKDRLFTLSPKITRALKEAEEIKEKKEAEERFNLATRASNDIIYEWNIEVDKVWRNDVYYNLLGINKEKHWLERSSWFDFVHPDDNERVRNSLEDFINSKENFWSSEYRFLDPKGNVYHFADRGYLLRDQDDKPIKMVGAVADISNLKDLITQLQKMLYMTSHRVRQPIVNILGLSSALDDSITDQGELVEIVNHIKQSAINLEEFTHELNDYIQSSKNKAENKIWV